MVSEDSAKRRIGGAISRGKTATPVGTVERAVGLQGFPPRSGTGRTWTVTRQGGRIRLPVGADPLFVEAR
jgi:hypothetical protein